MSERRGGCPWIPRGELGQLRLTIRGERHDDALHLQDIPAAAGQITIIRWVPVCGYIDVLGESAKVGRRLRFHDVMVTVETHPQRLKVDLNGRLIRQCVFQLCIS